MADFQVFNLVPAAPDTPTLQPLLLVDSFQSMSDHQPALATLVWRLQPRWLQRAMIYIALPAWCVFAIFGVLQGEFNSPLVHAAVAVFVCTGLLELFFVAKALWRQDI